MPAIRILELRAPLAPTLIQGPPWVEGEALLGALPEGDEELFLFDESGLLRQDSSEGPRLAGPLPKAQRVPGPAGSDLPAGNYAFVQFRAGSMEELGEALEDFARDCWWESLPASGPFYLRRIGEDGATALQLLRRLPGDYSRTA